jgi:hypothetical protein
MRRPIVFVALLAVLSGGILSSAVLDTFNTIGVPVKAAQT